MSAKYDGAEVTGNDAEHLAVLKHQASHEERLQRRIENVESHLETAITGSEALLRGLGRSPPDSVPGEFKLERGEPSIALRPWVTVLAEAQTMTAGPVGLADLISPEDVAAVERHISEIRSEFDSVHRLDGVDWAIAGVAGTFAALVDTFLVKMSRSPGFLGGRSNEGGPLSNFIRDKLRASCSPEQLRDLERRFPVPYDAAHSGGLSIPVSGLGPRTHRFQSLGHDPVVGFLIGTADILMGTMTAVSSTGQLVRQGTAAPPGLSLFEAIARQFGHLRSDLPTAAGLPAPLMPLLQLIGVGSIGEKGRTIGDVSRLMYAKGYDFGHFLAMSVAPMMIEVLVRACYSAKRLSEGFDLIESLPLQVPGSPPPPKLQTMLFVAHLISTAANAGRVCLGPAFNPLAINYPQWVAVTKYALGQLRWVLEQREHASAQSIQSKLDSDWQALNLNLQSWWTTPSPSGSEHLPELGSN
jgi:hypothetical protein